MVKELQCIQLIQEAKKNGEEIFKPDPNFQEKLKNALLSNNPLETDVENNIEKEFIEFIDQRLAGQTKAKKALAKAISLFNKV